MTQYTNQMVSEMQQIGSFDYDSANDFASKHGLSVRSVISKVKHLGLDYTRKPVVISEGKAKVRKVELVAAIAVQSGADPEAVAGLAKADVRSLANLLKAIG